jgi:[ribosomal protein S18]-alanine N-acetyltransferase
MMHWLKRFIAHREPVVAEAGSRDSVAIAALHAASFRRGWSEPEVERLLLDHQVIAHRIMIGGGLAGFIMSRQAADEAEILSVAVAARRQDRGLAGRLLSLHLRRLAGLGARAVFLEVDESNAAALRLYARAGFHEIARRPNYYAGDGGRTAAALVLRRDLT